MTPEQIEIMHNIIGACMFVLIFTFSIVACIACCEYGYYSTKLADKRRREFFEKISDREKHQIIEYMNWTKPTFREVIDYRKELKNARNQSSK